MPKKYTLTTPIFPNGITVVVRTRTYANGNLAVLLDAPDGEPIFKASTNTDLELDSPLFVCKNYSENEGLDIALETAGIAKRTGATICVGYATCPIMKLLSLAE